MRLIALSFTVFVASTGCIDRVAIRPDQLNVISNMGSPSEIGSAYAGNTRVSVVAVPTATVLRADGTTTDIRSPYAAIITNHEGDELQFDHPVQAHVDGGRLSIVGSNLPRTGIDLTQVKSVEITQLNMLKTMGLTVGLTSVVVTGLIVGILASAPH